MALKWKRARDPSGLVSAAMGDSGEKVSETRAAFAAFAQGKLSHGAVTVFSYAEWMRTFDTIGEHERITIRRQLRALLRHPCISIVLPVYNPDLTHLAAAIDSVHNQIYQNWELCIADDASTDAAVAPALEKIAASDRRIKLTFRSSNGHIAACSNSALTLATGEWITLLDQDDLLAPHALGFVAAEINNHRDVALIFSDEDKIDEQGERTEPYFKSDWNPELIRVQNFFNHLGVYLHSLVREVGGFREGFDGSQDYDLLLRCIERLRPEQIFHIPRVLYHWRKSSRSVAASLTAKSYALDSARRAVREFLQRQQICARVEPCPEEATATRVAYQLPDDPPRVSIVIPTRDQPKLLARCVQSVIEQTEYPHFNFVILDNGSVESETLALLQKLERAGNTRVIREESPFNFSKLVNRGVECADGPVIALLNDDVEVEDRGWLTEMVSQLAQAGVGAVGARLWYPNNTLQHGGVIFIGGVAAHAHWRIKRGALSYFNRAILQQNFSAVTAACMLVRKDVFQKAGGFDEENLAISFNDVDFCLRLGALGLRVVWTPYANLWHHESASRGNEQSPVQLAHFRSEARFAQEKWAAVLLRDSNYNPNLTAHACDFSLAWPPRLPPLSAGIAPVDSES